MKAFFIGREGEQAQAIVLIAITTMAMLMVVGLAIDAGQLYAARRTMQEAADAAAYAGAVYLYQQGSSCCTGAHQTAAFSSARNDATLNGFTNGVNGITLTVQQPTTTPFNTSKYVDVTISQYVRTALVPAEAGLNFVQVHAIAGSDPLNNNYAIMALDRGDTPCAFQDNASGQITLSGGGVLVNSTAPITESCGGGGSTGTGGAWNDIPPINWSISCPATNPCGIDVAGGASGVWPGANPGNNFTGLNQNAAQQADPFAGMPKPTTAGLLTDPSPFGPSNGTAQQGIYTSVLKDMKLCHGVYILKHGMGGDIDVDTTTSDPDRPGQLCDGKVFIFNTLTNYGQTGYPGTASCYPITVSGNHDVHVLPLDTGTGYPENTYAKMLLFQDPFCTQQVTLSGTSLLFNVGGTIYIPNANFRADGQTTVTGGQIVAKTVDTQNATLNISFVPDNSAQPILPRLTR